MKTRRWLLPFTHVVDMQAIDVAVRLAEHGKATLVALSLITPSQERRGQHRTPHIRPEHLQESGFAAGKNRNSEEESGQMGYRRGQKLLSHRFSGF
jgi:hypothetical protein